MWNEMDVSHRPASQFLIKLSGFLRSQSKDKKSAPLFLPLRDTLERLSSFVLAEERAKPLYFQPEADLADLNTKQEALASAQQAFAEFQISYQSDHATLFVEESELQYALMKADAADLKELQGGIKDLRQRKAQLAADLAHEEAKVERARQAVRLMQAEMAAKQKLHEHTMTDLAVLALFRIFAHFQKVLTQVRATTLPQDQWTSMNSDLLRLFSEMYAKHDTNQHRVSLSQAFTQLDSWTKSRLTATAPIETLVPHFNRHLLSFKLVFFAGATTPPRPPLTRCVSVDLTS